MTRLKLLLFALLLCSSVCAQENNEEVENMPYRGSSIYSKWVVTLDAPIHIPLFSNQRNFFDQKLNIYEHRVSTLGAELMKYYPNKNMSFGVMARYAYNAEVIHDNPILSLESNSIALDFVYRKSLSKKKPFYQDITTWFVGGGISLNYDFQSSLYAHMENSTLSYDALINRFKVFGIVSIGVIENLINVANRSSLAKLQIDVGLPFLSLANNFRGNYINLPSELEFLQKSRGSNYYVGVRYAQFIDLRKSRFQHYNHQLDNGWNEMIDPFKNYVPEIVKFNYPKKKFYGNFRYSFELFSKLDSLDSGGEPLFIRNKSFTSFEFGYSFHFFGNHNKYYNLYVLNDNGLRRDFFLSANLKSTYLSLNSGGLKSKLFALDAKFYAGFQLILAKINWNIAGGLGYTLSQLNPPYIPIKSSPTV